MFEAALLIASEELIHLSSFHLTIDESLAILLC